VCYWKDGLRQPGPRVLFLGRAKTSSTDVPFPRRRYNTRGGGATTIIIDAAGLHGGPWLVGYRAGRGRSGSGRGVPCTDFGDNTRASWYSVPPPPLSRSSCRRKNHRTAVSVRSRSGPFGRVDRRGNGAAAAAAVVVVTRVHLLCRHRSRSSSLLVIMRRRRSIVVAATTATETAARTMNTTTTTDSWSIRHRRSRWPFCPRKNAFNIILFSSYVRERDRTNPHTVPANASPPPERSQHTLPDWVAALRAGGIHGAYLHGLRDTGAQGVAS